MLALLLDFVVSFAYSSFCFVLLYVSVWDSYSYSYELQLLYALYVLYICI